MPAIEIPGKPPYLGLLNAIALAETRAGVELRAWAGATLNADLAGALRFVADRETSHGEVFHRRLRELGYDLRQKADPEADRRCERLANPAVPDCEKIPPRGEGGGGDPFADIHRQLAERRFDPMTANLLTWYIAEEYDSGRRLGEAYASVRASTGVAPERPNGHAALDTEAIVACMTAGFARLEKSLEKIAKARK